MNASGVASPKSNPPVEFDENENMEWKVEMPVGSSSPVMWNNQIFLTAFEKDKQVLLTLALNRRNGELLWCDTITPEKFEVTHTLSNPAAPTAAVDESGVYVYFASYGLRSYDLDGELKWEYPLVVPENVLYGNPGSPVIMDDKLILCRDLGNEESCLLALNKHTGEIVWKSLIQENTPINFYGFAGYSTPVKYNDQIILHRGGGVASYSLSDGTPIWWYPVLTNGISTPVVYNNAVYVAAWMEYSEEERRGEAFSYNTFDEMLNDLDSNDDGFISLDEIPDDLMVFTRPEIADIELTSISLKLFFNRIDTDKDRLISEDEWTNILTTLSGFVTEFGTMAIPLDLKGEISDEDILWMELEKNPEVPSPVAYNDCVYIVKNGGWLTCMNAESGEVYYQDRVGPAGACLASPVIADDKIYLSSYNGVIMVLETGENPVVISESKLDGKITATPAIVGNDMYIRTSEYLYSFEQ